MLNNILCAVILTSITCGISKGSVVESDKTSIENHDAPENANLDLHHRLQTLENLRAKDTEEYIMMKETTETYDYILKKALTDITMLKHEFGKLQYENNRLHSKLDNMMLRNVELFSHCEKQCRVSEKGRFRESADTYFLDKVTNNTNTHTYASIPVKPTTATQDTLAAKSTNPLHSNHEGIIRRSPVPLPGMQRVAEGTGGRGFFAKSTTTIRAVSVGHTIIFNSITTNTHNDYNDFSGAFTCGTPGLYVLSWTIQINIHYLKSQMLKNGVAVADGYTGDDERYRTSGTNTAVLSLAQGDVIVIHVSERPGSIDILPHVTSFSGFLTS